MTSQHWYTNTGEPRHGLGLREARKENLFPSVSAILSVWPQDGLKKWLRMQDIVAAHTTPRLLTESDEEWTERVIAGADEESAKARDTGTRRHAIIEQFNRGQMKIGYHDPIDLAHIQPYVDWHIANVRKVRYAERIVVNKELGYAGTLDLDCILQSQVGIGFPVPALTVNHTALVDVKNRKRLSVYDTDCMQLVAYDAAGFEVTKTETFRADKLISIVLGTERQEILVREWTPEEIDRAWKNFKLCLELWCASREYWPVRGAL